jgi:lactoylglutathione lyase
MTRRFYVCAVATIIVMIGLAISGQSVAQENATTEAHEVLTVGMNHVGLTVIDLDKSVAFFVETLDWKEVGGYPDYPSKFVTDGEIFLTLWRATNPESAIRFDRKNNVGLHHLALTVTSFEALDILHARFLETDGVVIEFSPELNGPGPTKHMMIREPSGNRLEFAYTPPRK